jgi:hypothetical protein
MSFLYSNLPPKTYSLREFIAAAKDLEQHEDFDAFVTFTLTGKVSDSHQAVVDLN